MRSKYLTSGSVCWFRRQRYPLFVFRVLVLNCTNVLIYPVWMKCTTTLYQKMRQTRFQFKFLHPISIDHSRTAATFLWHHAQLVAQMSYCRVPGCNSRPPKNLSSTTKKKWSLDTPVCLVFSRSDLKNVKTKKKNKASPQLLPKALHSHLRLLGFLVVYTVI